MAAKGRIAQQEWVNAAPSPLVLVSGPEDFLASRVLQQIRAALAELSPELEVHDLDAADYAAGEIFTVASPSLFAEPRLVRIENVEKANEAFVKDALQYVAEPADDCTIVFRHAGGNRGKALLDAIRTNSVAAEFSCPEIKYENQRVDFVRAEFQRLGGSITPMAARMLAAAYGSELGELASACAQLFNDSGKQITEVEVERATEGRVETNGFKVADAAAAGRTAEALLLLRQALAAGAQPVQLVAALNGKIRQMARVFGAKASNAELAKQFKMPDWLLKRAQGEIRGWREEDLARGVERACEAEFLVKGGTRDAVYVLERLVVFIARRGRV